MTKSDNAGVPEHDLHQVEEFDYADMGHCPPLTAYDRGYSDGWRDAIKEAMKRVGQK